MRIIGDTKEVDNMTLTIEFTGKELGILTTMLWNVTASELSAKMQSTMYKELKKLKNRNVSEDELNSLIAGFEDAFESL